MKEQNEKEENESFEYYLEVGEDGNLYGVTEYETIVTFWLVNATIEIDDEIYLISL